MRPSTSLPYKVSLWNVLTVPGAARRFNAKKGKECLPWRRNQHGQPIHNNKKNNILIILMVRVCFQCRFTCSRNRPGSHKGSEWARGGSLLFGVQSARPARAFQAQAVPRSVVVLSNY